jgi:hypothetical protein
MNGSTVSCSPTQSLSSGDNGVLFANPEKVSVPSAATLGARYRYMLENEIIEEFRDKWNGIESLLNITALEKAASSVMGSCCTSTYKISQGENVTISCCLLKLVCKTYFQVVIIK